MKEVIKEDILKVLLKSIEAVDNRNYYSLELLSNRIIHNASIFQDEFSTSMAIIIYALSKIASKTEIVDQDISNELKKSYMSLKENDDQKFEKNIQKLYKLIETQDSKLKYYFKHVLDQAKVKKGTKIHDHGISTTQVAAILGRSKWEIMNYVGKTDIPDSYSPTNNVKSRIEYTRSLFKK